MKIKELLDIRINDLMKENNQLKKTMSELKLQRGSIETITTPSGLFESKPLTISQTQSANNLPKGIQNLSDLNGSNQ